MLASIIIRTLNEARHLETLLKSIQGQKVTEDLTWEVVLIDSGSTDGTVEVAEQYGCRMGYITRQEFSFGRSLNRGCEMADGDIYVLISGHCIPVDEHWLQRLCQPLMTKQVSYTYGGQMGGEATKYSEKRIFAKYFPKQPRTDQEGYFCNNANSALTKNTWDKYRFDEEVTGLEDMELAKRLVGDGGKVAYIADACVFHLHDESWQQIKRRFEREAIALQQIMPQVHIHRYDLLRYVLSSVWLDFKAAKHEGKLFKHAKEIVLYRICQYWGSYKGNHNHRVISHAQKEVYFYPD